MRRPALVPLALAAALVPALVGCPREQKQAPAPQVKSDPVASASAAPPSAKFVVGKTSCSSSASLRADGLALATDCGASTTVWDLAAGKAVATLATGGEGVSSFTFGRPSGHVGASLAGHTFRVWDLTTGERLHDSDLLVEHVEIAPSDAFVMVGNENGFFSLLSLDASSSKSVFSAQLHDGNVGTPCRYFFTADSAVAVVVEPTRLVLVDTKSGKRRDWPGGSGDVDTGAKVHPSLPLVVVGTVDGAIELVDATSAKTKTTLRPKGKAAAGGAAPGVQSVDFSADGSLVAAVVEGQLEIYETATAKKLRAEPLATADAHASASFGAASWLALQQEGADVVVFDLASAAPSKKLAGCTFGSFSGDGLRVVCSARVFDVVTGKAVDRPKMPAELSAAGDFWQVGSGDAGLQLRRARDGAMLTFVGAPATGATGATGELVVFGEGGSFLGKREAAAKLLSKVGEGGKAVPVSDAELTAHERPTLLADFVAGR